MPRFFNKLSKLWIRPGKSKTNIGRETELGHGQGVGVGKNGLWNVKGMLKLFDNENLEPTVFLEMSNNEKVWRHIHHQRQDKVKWTNRGNIKRKKTFKSWKWKKHKTTGQSFLQNTIYAFENQPRGNCLKTALFIQQSKNYLEFCQSFGCFPSQLKQQRFPFICKFTF